MWGLGCRGISSTMMEDQLDKKKDTEMETGFM